MGSLLSQQGPETEPWERAREPPAETLIKYGVQHSDVVQPRGEIKTQAFGLSRGEEEGLLDKTRAENDRPSVKFLCGNVPLSRAEEEAERCF